MYVPSSFVEPDRDRLHDFVEQNGFGVLVSQHAGLPTATHLPFLLDRNGGPQGTLSGHIARANPQWRDAEGQPALAVFSGPHAYVSPAWYETEKMVPTWNYVAVHATGRLRVIEDPDELRPIVQASVAAYEAPRPSPWQLEPGEYLERMLKLIVGFRIEIERLEGAWKLSQNHPVERRERVIGALEGNPETRPVAALMRQTLPGKTPESARM